MCVGLLCLSTMSIYVPLSIIVWLKRERKTKTELLRMSNVVHAEWIGDHPANTWWTTDVHTNAEEIPGHDWVPEKKQQAATSVPRKSLNENRFLYSSTTTIKTQNKRNDCENPNRCASWEKYLGINTSLENVSSPLRLWIAHSTHWSLSDVCMCVMRNTCDMRVQCNVNSEKMQ